MDLRIIEIISSMALKQGYNHDVMNQFDAANYKSVL